ncbi:hypothetical protein N7462_002978 [Penicillium macrosclerotiorum]|uniref:uncharacterized protein n=1 Tax=Penicillium macrosclerotiorum TaxID=303699 RepID=UPI002546BBE8|nr:uncharacterized protein N7462_002978 [Penicillium macrosclerotiorum]KAJ5688586.1 hypothetical protein N7462_002978 [Penicillium macrosclerotiorum]
MALSRTLGHEIAAIGLLATSLYGSIYKSSNLTKRAHIEVGLLLDVLGVTELCCKLRREDYVPPALNRALGSCQSALQDLQRLEQASQEVELSSTLLEIQDRFSSLIFELNMMNVDMMISTQNNANRMLQGYLDQVKTGERDLAVLIDVLDDTFPKLQKGDAWRKLQQELHDMGIMPEWSDRDHDYIISTIREAIDKEDLLKSIKQKSNLPDSPDIPTDTSMNGSSGKAEEQPTRDTPPVPTQPSDRDHSDKEVLLLPTEDLPIPVAFEFQGTFDMGKQALPIDDFPIPIATEQLWPGSQDTRARALAQVGLPIPVESEINHFPIPVAPDTSTDRTSETRSKTGSVRINAHLQPPTTRKKRASLVSRMKYKLTTSKEEFIALVQMGGLYSVRVALDKGADVNTSNLDGQTALMVAVSFRHTQIVKLLLEYGALPNKVSAQGDTALGTAALMGLDDIVQMLLQHGANVEAAKNLGKTALSQAAAAGHESIVRRLLNAGAEPNTLCSSGDTALSRAALYGRVPIARLLLDCGADVNKTAYPWKTAIWKAAHDNRAAMAELLMQRGADPTIKDSRGQTPLELVATFNYTEIIGIFQRYGYNVVKKGGSIQHC